MKACLILFLGTVALPLVVHGQTPEDPFAEREPGPFQLFVTGTDTGVGKTQASCALLSLLVDAGLRPQVWVGETRPVLLVVEDLHWADSSTRHFLGFLARTICSERLLVLGTYRSDELHRRHPLRPLFAELASDPYTRLLELPRFTPDELA